MLSKIRRDDEEQQVLIQKGLEKSKRIQEHLEQVLSLLREEKEAITLLFQPNAEK